MNEREIDLRGILSKWEEIHDLLATLLDEKAASNEAIDFITSCYKYKMKNERSLL